MAVQNGSNRDGRGPPVNHTVSYFGWRRTKHVGSRTSRYFYPVDVRTFVPTVDDFPGDTHLARLLTFGIELRDFCVEMQIKPRTSGPGLAGQLLQHPHFYPAERRRVPEFINEYARNHLPGNHYGLFVGAGENSEAATYIDQSAAHHYAAQTAVLPHADNILARGYSKVQDKPWLAPGDTQFRRVLDQPGLFRVQLWVPTLGLNKFQFTPPIMWKEGTHVTNIWSSELHYLESCGARVNYIIAAYSSPLQDTGLPKYAKWAQDMTRYKPWLKQTLLTAYGVLASRTRISRKWLHPGGTLQPPGCGTIGTLGCTP